MAGSEIGSAIPNRFGDLTPFAEERRCSRFDYGLRPSGAPAFFAAGPIRALKRA